MIKDPVLLLISWIMLLIDNNESQIGKWQKERRARTGDDPDFTGRNLPPELFALFW